MPPASADRHLPECIALVGPLYADSFGENIVRALDLNLAGVRGFRVRNSFTGEYVNDRSDFPARILVKRLYCVKVRSANARLFEATASVGFVGTHSSPRIGAFFDAGTEVVTVVKAVELHETIGHYLRVPNKRLAIMAASQRRADADHTYENRLGTLGQPCGY